jgi:uncharacterized membrane protein YqjE
MDPSQDRFVPEQPADTNPWGDYLAARLALLQVEIQEATYQAKRKGALSGAMAACVVFGWALLLAGLAGCLSQVFSIPWYYLILGLAALHFVAAIICLLRLRRPSPSTFQASRAEFEHDRTWLNELTTKWKSRL